MTFKEPSDEPLEPVVLVLDTAHRNQDVIQLAIVWSDCLVQAFSFNTVTRGLKHGPARTVQIQTGNVCDPVIAYHHPYITLPIWGKDSGDDVAKGIKIVEINTDPEWPRITSFKHHGPLTIFSAKWRQSTEEIHLDILKRDPKLCLKLNWEAKNETEEVPFEIDSAKLSDMLRCPDECVLTHSTAFNVVKNKGDQLQYYRLAHPLLTHDGSDISFKKLFQHLTYTRVSTMTLEQADKNKYYRPVLDHKGNIVLLEGRACVPFGMSNLESRILARPADKIDRYDLTAVRKFTPTHIPTVQPPRQPQRAPRNFNESLLRVGREVAPPEAQAMSIDNGNATTLDDERLAIWFSERDRLTTCWIRIQVYDFRYTVDSYFAALKPLKFKTGSDK